MRSQPSMRSSNATCLTNMWIAKCRLCAVAFFLVFACFCGACRRAEVETQTAVAPTPRDLHTSKDSEDFSTLAPKTPRPLSAGAEDRAHQELTAGNPTAETALPTVGKIAASAKPPVVSHHPLQASPPQNSATISYQAARAVQQKAQAAAKRGQLASAYSDTLSAWESMREFTDDQDCRALSAELIKELEAYGQKLSSRQSGLPPNTLDKPVRFE